MRSVYPALWCTPGEGHPEALSGNLPKHGGPGRQQALLLVFQDGCWPQNLPACADSAHLKSTQRQTLERFYMPLHLAYIKREVENLGTHLQASADDSEERGNCRRGARMANAGQCT